MSYSLPSLTALRVFEVAGRMQSFSNAALELNVTQGAVSRQIRALEDELGLKLFLRKTRHVVLTDAGKEYLVNVQSALAQIERSTAAMMGKDKRSKLVISVLPSVGSYWLMTRLAHFTERHPFIETRIISSIDPVNLHSREGDVAIRVGPLPGRNYPPAAPRVDLTMVTDWKGVIADELAPDVLIPVIAPALGVPAARFTRPQDVLAHPLIHMSSRPNAWPDWLDFHGLSFREPRRYEYGHFFMSLQAAREGKGIALVPDILLSDASLADMIPLPQYRLRSAGEYYLLSLADRSREREIRLFRAWIQEQVSDAGKNRTTEPC